MTSMPQSPASHPLAERSRAALVGAARTLLEQQDPAEISITALVARAGLTRPTFYQHYQDLGELFAAAGLWALAEILEELPEPRYRSFAPALSQLVQKLLDRALFFDRVFSGSGGGRMVAGSIHLLSAWLPDHPGLQPQHEVPGYWQFLASGIVWNLAYHVSVRAMADRGEIPPQDLPDPVPELLGILDQLALLRG